MLWYEKKFYGIPRPKENSDYFSRDSNTRPLSQKVVTVKTFNLIDKKFSFVVS